MGHFYAWKFKARYKLLSILLLSFLCALFLYIKPFPILSVFTSDVPTVITKGNQDIDKVSLTFNITWGDTKVHDILDTLKEHDVQATFFISGEWAERHPHILEKIAENKHEIGMLGYRYKSYVEQDIEAVKQDIQDAIQVFNKLDFDYINYIRPPSGHFNKEIVEMLEQVELEPVRWSVHPNDSENPGVDKITKELSEDVTGGDIVLLHASDSAKQTSDALQKVLPIFQNKKLELVTLSELIDEVEIDEQLVE